MFCQLRLVCIAGICPSRDTEVQGGNVCLGEGQAEELPGEKQTWLQCHGAGSNFSTGCVAHHAATLAGMLALALSDLPSSL